MCVCVCVCLFVCLFVMPMCVHKYSIKCEEIGNISLSYHIHFFFVCISTWCITREREAGRYVKHMYEHKQIYKYKVCTNENATFHIKILKNYN